MPDDPINIGDIEWVPFRFKDLEDDELFWFHTRRENNPAFRKVDDTTALILAEQRTFPLDNIIVYQKEH